MFSYPPHTDGPPAPSPCRSVHRVLPVPDSVHARYSAVGREYLYRLGVVRAHAWSDGDDGRTVRTLTPIGERYRSYIVG